MKRMLCILALLLALFCVLAACNETTPPPSDNSTVDEGSEHTHDQGEWKTVTEPTCTQDGKQERSCTSCNEVLETRSVPATGHTYTDAVTTPTCTAGGYTTHTCACGDSYQDTPTPPAGHSHTPVVTPPTCTAGGYTTHTCACGDSYQDTPTSPRHSYGTDNLCIHCGKPQPGLYDANNTQLANWEELEGYGLSTTRSFSWRDYHTVKYSPYYVLKNTPALAGGVKLVVDELTAIPNYFFYCCSTLSEIIIPDSVTQIGENAFFSCTALAEINIPASVTAIGTGAFLRCSAMTSFTVESGNTVYSAAGNCLIHTASKTLISGFPSSTIPSDGSVTAIGVQAFYNYESMTSITIPASVTSIGDYAFSECTALDSIIFTCMPSKWSAISFGNDWNMMAGDCTVSYPNISSVTTPPSCFVAGYTTNTCSCCNQSYKTNEVPASHSYGANNASCTSCGQTAPGLYASNGTLIASWEQLLEGQEGLNLEKNYSDTQYEYGMGFNNFLFRSGTKLVVGNVSFIGSNVFRDCWDLKIVEIPENVAYIGKRAFAGCYNIKTVIISSPTTTRIEAGAFLGCTALESISLPSTITSIGQGAFENCSNLKSINLPEGLTEIQFMTFSGCESLNNITLPDSLRSLGVNAFTNCKALTSIHIPANITAIQSETFSNCISLESVTFAPNSKLTTIYDSAFWYCTSLAEIKLPASVTSIGRHAFSYAKLIETVDGVDYVGNWAVDYSSELTRLTLRAGTVGIAGYVYYQENSAIVPYKKNTTLQSIWIPASLKHISLYAFVDCTALTTVTFEQGSQLQDIGTGAFYGCVLLEGIALPDSIKAIGDYAFWGCSELETVTLSTNAQLQSIGNYAFQNCVLLNGVTLPDTLVTIGKYAFKNCAKLESIVIPASVTLIDESAFSGCSELASVTLAANGQLATIGAYAFQSCSKLESIAIPTSVTTIGKDAFTTSGLKTASLAVKTGWKIYSFQYKDGSDIIEYYLKYAESAAEIASYLKNSDFGSYEWRRTA